MKLERIIHPVGQGAFYTEQIRYAESVYTFVYDCGSSNQLPLDNQIKRMFCKDDIIDGLFISHFHADHINGLKQLLERCNIKQIYIPQVPEDIICIMIAIAKQTNKQELANFLESPENFIRKHSPSIKIIHVKTIIDDSKLTLEKNETNNSIESGEAVELQHSIREKENIKLWRYVPINIENATAVDNIRKYISDNSLDLTNCTFEALSQLANKYKHKINNLYCLIVYSTSADSQNEYKWEERISPEHLFFRLTCNNFPFLKNNIQSVLRFLICYKRYGNINIPYAPSCLYLGDSNLRNEQTSKTIEKCLDQYGKIATLQIPHHGSWKNFNEEFIKKHCSNSELFVSYSTTNRYGHPSCKLELFVCSSCNALYSVTENYNSILVKCYKGPPFDHES